MKNIITSLICLFGFISCTEYLTREPISIMSDDNYWNNENSIRTFANKFYDKFDGFGNAASGGDFYFKGVDDNMLRSGGPELLTINIPTTAATWNYEYVRKANLMFERVETMNLLPAEKQHWLGFARLFRAWEFANLVKHYGDVPWIEKYYTGEDADLYRPRDPRAMVMDKVLEDFNFAITNLRDNDGPNRINKDVARAMMARTCLFEGTFRKYHNLPDGAKFLEAAAKASVDIMNSTAKKYQLSTNYSDIYTSLDLGKNNEVLLFKMYLPAVLMHGTSGYLSSSTPINGLNKFAVESYLCKDGLPISSSPLYQGDATIQDVLANRDGRLAQTIDNSYAYLGNPYEGTTSISGYKFKKYLCKELSEANKLSPSNDSDAPIFWLAEIYLTYAEAKAELGTLTQDDLDLSINKLRARAGVAKLILASIPNDPKRDPSVSPLFWEIRRERQIEMMYDGHRKWDLLRWKKGEYLDIVAGSDKLRGAKVTPNEDIKLQLDANNYILQTVSNPRVFLEKNYLEPVPSGQFPLYPAGVLVQNPLWTK